MFIAGALDPRLTPFEGAEFNWRVTTPETFRSFERSRRRLASRAINI